MKLIGTVLGFDIGTNNDIKTDSDTKKEANTSTTTEQNKNFASEQNRVREDSFLYLIKYFNI
jgi:hypothetical protein